MRRGALRPCTVIFPHINVQIVPIPTRLIISQPIKKERPTLKALPPMVAYAPTNPDDFCIGTRLLGRATQLLDHGTALFFVLPLLNLKS